MRIFTKNPQIFPSLISKMFSLTHDFPPKLKKLANPFVGVAKQSVKPDENFRVKAFILPMKSCYKDPFQ